MGGKASATRHETLGMVCLVRRSVLSLSLGEPDWPDRRIDQIDQNPAARLPRHIVAGRETQAEATFSCYAAFRMALRMD